MRIFLTYFFIVFILGHNLVAQEKLELEVQQTYATFLGDIPPLRDLPAVAATDQKKRKERKKATTTVPNFNSRLIRPKGIDNPFPQGADRVRQSYSGRAASSHAPPIVVEPKVNIDGMDYTDFGGLPPDPAGDIGADYYVHAINATVYRVYDKQGNDLTGNINANTLWSQIGFSSAGDPIIVFDQSVNRWFITEFAPPGVNTLLVAVSDSSDPLGSYKAYGFATPTFPDYPKYSIWSDALVVTSNEEGPSNLPTYFLNKAQMFAGAEFVDVQRISIPGYGNGPGFQLATPVDWTGNNLPANDNPLILKVADDNWGTGDADHVELLEFAIDWNDANNTTSQSSKIYSAAFDTNPCSATGFGFSCIPQLGGNGIDGIPEVIMNKPEYRNFGTHESIVLNFIVDATGSDLSGIRWMELRRTDGSDWELYQEGTYAPDDGLHRFMGSCSIDGAGNIGLAYSVSSAETHPGLRFTGRLADDPLGELTVDEVVLVEGSGTAPTDRYGDYPAMSVDPIDQRTFWFTSQYQKENGFGTRIASFELSRDSIDIGVSRLLSPSNSVDLALGQSLVGEILQIEVKNYGLTPITNFSLGFIDHDGTEYSEALSQLLEPDDTYIHTFPQSVYLTELGDYDFKLFTALNGDQAIFNDTLSSVITKLPRTDLSLKQADGFPFSSCESSLAGQVRISNAGIAPITTFDIQTTINGVAGDVTTWNGDLAPGASILRNIFIDGLEAGENTISVEVLTVNNVVDELPESNTFSRTINLIADPVLATMFFTTDLYPGESAWELTDDQGNVVASGGGYTQTQTTYESEFCLSLSECYTLEVTDTYGDGIYYSGVTGNYEILNEAGEVIASILEPSFGTIETNAFCADPPCILDVELSATGETIVDEGNGILIININGGVAPFQYSIDGGSTFSESNVFDMLATGSYDVVVTDSAGEDCSFTGIIDIPSCGIELDIIPGADNLLINANNLNGTTQYSIDGGNSFQEFNFFNNLDEGAYTVVVIDEFGCIAVELTSVGITGIEDDVQFDDNVLILPNPNEGAFKVIVKGLPQSDVSLPFQIYSIDGKRVRNGALTWYSGDYVGMTSIALEPSGVYFLRFLRDDYKRVVRIIKD